MAPGQLQWINLQYQSPIQLYQQPEYQLQQLHLNAPNKVVKLIGQLEDWVISYDKRWGYYKKGQRYYMTPLKLHKSAQVKAILGENLHLAKTLSPPQEWRQIFNETFNYMVEQLYDPNLHGIDKQALYDNYAAYLPQITSRDELQQLLQHMSGQISVSHIRIDNGDSGYIATNNDKIGLLGAEFVKHQGRYRISQLYHQGTKLHSAYAPLDQYGNRAKQGDYLISINNQQVTTAHNLYRYLRGSQNQLVTLKIADNPQGTDAKQIIVKTIKDDNPLLTDNWAQANQKYVNQLTEGKIKYVHFFGANLQGVENTISDFYHLGDAKGFIIDLRYNRGGITMDGLIELLKRQGIYQYRFRQGVDLSVPINAFNGQTTIIINQYNASAAETFALMFKQSGLGEVIGQPTLGAGIGPYAFNKHLIDGALIQIPNRGAFLSDGVTPDKQWPIENRGVQPSQYVNANLYQQNNPYKVADDPQLNAAIKASLAQQQRHPPLKYPQLHYPKLRYPKHP